MLENCRISIPPSLIKDVNGTAQWKSKDGRVTGGMAVGKCRAILKPDFTGRLPRTQRSTTLNQKLVPKYQLPINNKMELQGICTESALVLHTAIERRVEIGRFVHHVSVNRGSDRGWIPCTRRSYGELSTQKRPKLPPKMERKHTSAEQLLFLASFQAPSANKNNTELNDGASTRGAQGIRGCKTINWCHHWKPKGSWDIIFACCSARPNCPSCLTFPASPWHPLAPQSSKNSTGRLSAPCHAFAYVSFAPDA